MSYSRCTQKTIPGIIGGLGPLAHTIFEQILIEQNTKRGAERDQDHPLWLLVNATNIPDRTQSLSGKADSCVPWLIKYGKFLESAGVDFIVVPCNTAHAFHEQVQSQLQIPWIHLIDCTTQFLVENYHNTNKVGILATDGTLQSQLYHNSLLNSGFTPIYFQIGSESQKLVMNTIFDPSWGIKATGSQISPAAQKHLITMVDHLALLGAEIILAGCTELSVGFKMIEDRVRPWIDPLEIVANVTLDLAFGYRSLQTDNNG